MGLMVYLGRLGFSCRFSAGHHMLSVFQGECSYKKVCLYCEILMYMLPNRFESFFKEAYCGNVHFLGGFVNLMRAEVTQAQCFFVSI